MNTKEIPSRSITINGTEYPLRFGQNAMYRLDQRVYQMEDVRVANGAKPRELSMAFKDDASGQFVLIPMQGIQILHKYYPTYMKLQVMLWAALETGRIKSETPKLPFTMDAVGDLIDAAGGLTEVEPELMLAFNDCAESKFAKEYLETLTKRIEARKNGQPAPESASVPEDLPIRKRGKNVSSKASKRDSPSTNSGN